MIFKRREIVNGRYIRKYEKKFAEYMGVKYAFSFGAGRMAFYSILKAIGIEDGDEVILPGYTCVVVPDAIVYSGAKPIYIDIDPDTLCIDVNKIEAKITPRTRVIYAQHTFASFCNMQKILDIAKRHNLKVIEDCAHALGAEYNGKKAGTYGDAAYFTTELSKIISTGMGGMAITDDFELAKKIAQIQKNSQFLDQEIIEKISLQIIIYNILLHPRISFIGKFFLNFFYRYRLNVESTTCDEMNCIMPEKYPVKLSNIQARVGLLQLENIHKNIKHRRKIAQIYRKLLKDSPVKLYESYDELYLPVYIRYNLLVKNRDELKEKFLHNNCDLGEWFNSVIHPKGSSFDNVYYKKGTCPIAEEIVKNNVNLPTHLRVKENDAKRIANIIKRC
ncbi:MAG: aminotransferase class I/II-fold pyridoxal phosphate-dependent enzyme [Candidatus Methanoperedens sp.]|nr:aminotransferase class I/II-fold pyridoxal phosphate-dependent enzyme [Candidatus Methanoperedens sp.]